MSAPKPVTASSRSQQDGWWLLGGMLALFGAVGTAWASLHLAAFSTGAPAPAANPAQLAADLAASRTRWTTAATVWALAIALSALALVALISWPFMRASRRAKRPDRSARYMGKGKDTAHLRAGGAAKKGARLAPSVKAPGLAFGINVADRRCLYSSWEDMLLLLAGPRTQKSVAYAIPTMLAAPGCAFGTANKPDVRAATHALRAKVGQVFTFDPQGISDAGCQMWWNPLTYIAPLDPATGRAARDSEGRVIVDETRATKLARQFVTSAPGGISHGGSDYFEKRGATLISYLLLAAAAGEQPIVKVRDWLDDPGDQDPNDHLDAAGLQHHSNSLRTLRNMTEKQRQGVYDGAADTMEFLSTRKFAPWITAPTGALGAVTRPQFDPRQFARSSDTLYLLSDDDDSGAGPLVAALTVAIIDGLQDEATLHGGRLPIPAVGVLDEAANICKFRRLDSLYSYFGSKGILLLTVLQSPSQAKEVWGELAFNKLFSASNVKIYGGGIDDASFLQDLSTLIGTKREVVATVSRSRHGRTTSYDTRDEAILTVANLRELPGGRAVALASGTPAMLIEPVPWFEGDRAKEISTALSGQA